MAISQNARFSGTADPDNEYDHPLGSSIAKLLKDSLSKRGWVVSEIDNWRDSGWAVKCCRPLSTLQLVIAKMAKGEEWFLQIAPTYVPGFIGWLLKKNASAQPDAVQALAQDCFSILWETGRYREFMWCWDGLPEPGNSSAEPDLPICSDPVI